MNQVQGNSISAALLITRVELAELLGPGFRRKVESSDWLSVEGVLQSCREVELTGFHVLGKQLSSTMAQQLVQRNNQSERFLRVLAHKLLIFKPEELDGAHLGSRVHISQVDVLETFLHSDVIVIWDVDADRGPRACECEDLIKSWLRGSKPVTAYIQVREVRLRELVLFEVFGPGELSNQAFSSLDKGIEQLGGLFVDDRYESFKLSPAAGWVQVGLDKADVRLNDRTNIADPVPLRILMLVDPSTG